MKFIEVALRGSRERHSVRRRPFVKHPMTSSASRSGFRRCALRCVERSGRVLSRRRLRRRRQSRKQCHVEGESAAYARDDGPLLTRAALASLEHPKELRSSFAPDAVRR
eukprot:5498466-Pleurochrysis_carterae.AAC.2